MPVCEVKTIFYPNEVYRMGDETGQFDPNQIVERSNALYHEQEKFFAQFQQLRQHGSSSRDSRRVSRKRAERRDGRSYQGSPPHLRYTQSPVPATDCTRESYQPSTFPPHRYNPTPTHSRRRSGNSRLDTHHRPRPELPTITYTYRRESDLPASFPPYGHHMSRKPSRFESNRPRRPRSARFDADYRTQAFGHGTDSYQPSSFPPYRYNPTPRRSDCRPRRHRSNSSPSQRCYVAPHEAPAQTHDFMSLKRMQSPLHPIQHRKVDKLSYEDCLDYSKPLTMGRLLRVFGKEAPPHLRNRLLSRSGEKPILFEIGDTIEDLLENMGLELLRAPSPPSEEKESLGSKIKVTRQIVRGDAKKDLETIFINGYENGGHVERGKLTPPPPCRHYQNIPPPPPPPLVIRSSSLDIPPPPPEVPPSRFHRAKEKDIQLTKHAKEILAALFEAFPSPSDQAPQNYPQGISKRPLEQKYFKPTVLTAAQEHFPQTPPSTPEGYFRPIHDESLPHFDPREIDNSSPPPLDQNFEGDIPPAPEPCRLSPPLDRDQISPMPIAIDLVQTQVNAEESFQTLSDSGLAEPAGFKKAKKTARRVSFSDDV